jgi:hypothetical protein
MGKWAISLILIILMVLCGFLISGCGDSGVSPSLIDKSSLMPPSDFAETVEDAGGIDSTFEPPDRMIGSDRRMAVVYECWYALRRSYINTPNASGPYGGLVIDNCVVSDWNYLASDYSSTNWMVTSAPTYTKYITQCTDYPTASFLCSNTYGLKNGYGRGMQCVAFARYILYRALRYSKGPTSWSTYVQGANGSASLAKPGDLVFRYNSVNKSGHVAVCVKNMGASGIDVVDSNQVGYKKYGKYSIAGGPDSEIIGRHPISLNTINTQGWKTYSGRGRWY